MRFHNHCNKAHNKLSHKRNWVNALRKLGLKPVMSIVDEVPEEDWKYWEKFWIAQFRTWGFNLTNHTSGGDGLTFGNQTSFKKGSIPWNIGTAKPKILKGNKGKTPNSIKNQFKLGFEPWNKGDSGYKLSGAKASKPVIQMDLMGKELNEFPGSIEAGKAMKLVSGESIRLACLGKNKTAAGFTWKFKT